MRELFICGLSDHGTDLSLLAQRFLRREYIVVILLAVLLPIEIACGGGSGKQMTGSGGPGGGAVHQYATGKGPTWVASGDFNGDKKLDLAVTNSDNTVSVLLGNGDGTFRQHVDYPADTSLSAVAAADFNSDGKQDLAVASTSNGLLLGNGDGTFQAITPLPTLAYLDDYTAVAVGDLNGDGKPDLFFVNPGLFSEDFAGGGEILLGNGDGTFVQVNPDAVYFFISGGFQCLVLEDFNGDGELDVAAGESYTDDAGGGAYVDAALGNGDGTFPQPSRISNGFNTGYGVALGDFNGDGKQDIVTGCVTYINNGYSTCVSLFLGNGDGTFQGGPAFTDPKGGLPTALAVADFNADGKQDVVVLIGDHGRMSVLLGNGDGTFQTQVDYPTGTNPTSMVVGDFNGDGKLDLAVTNKDDNTVSILLGNGDGTFR